MAILARVSPGDGMITPFLVGQVQKPLAHRAREDYSSGQSLEKERGCASGVSRPSGATVGPFHIKIETDANIKPYTCRS